MMQHEDAASFVYGIAKRCRKYYLGLTTITQDVADFMQSKYGKAVITNSSIQLLLKQSPATIDVVKETFNLSDEEKYLLLECDVGEGIFCRPEARGDQNHRFLHRRSDHHLKPRTAACY